MNRVDKVGRNDPCPCGSGKKYKQCCIHKAAPASTKAPSIAQLLQAGDKAHFAKRYDEAIQIADAVLTISPENIHGMHLKAVVCAEIGELDEAENWIKKAILKDKKNTDFWNTLGLILHRQQRWNEAIEYFQYCLALKPEGTAEIWNNLGRSFMEAQDYMQAIPCFKKSIDLDKKHVAAHMNLAVCLQKTSHYDQSAEVYEDLLKFKETAIIHNNLSISYYELKKKEEALKHSQKAIELKPDYYEAWRNIGQILQDAGDQEKTIAKLNEIIERFPDKNIPKMEKAFLIPAIPQSNKHIDEIRQTFMQDMGGLIASGVSLEGQINELRFFPFYLGYQGRNNKDIMLKLAEVFTKTCPSLNYYSPALFTRSKPVGRNLRVGFVSAYFYDHVVARCYNNMIENLTGFSGIDVIAFGVAVTVRDEMLKSLQSKCRKFVFVPPKLDEARSLIEKEEIDILIYTDIGMHPFTYILAFSRLAPIQCVLAGGHPITSGIPTIDYTLTSKLWEPEDIADHYTETPVLFNDLAVFTYRMTAPEKNKTKSELGLPEGDVHLYACPVFLFRIHPDMDSVFKVILERDPKAKIVLFEYFIKNNWREQIMERFGLTMPSALLKRIIIVPHAKRGDFIGILQHMDAVMDCFHFSMGTTYMTTISSDIPVVTWPGEFLRGRIGYGYYKKMGVDELIAYTREDFIESVLKLANDKVFHKAISQKIAENKTKLFDDFAVLPELADFLYQKGKELAA